MTNPQSVPQSGPYLRKLKIYCPLVTVLGISIIFVLFVLKVPLEFDFGQFCAIAAFLCLVGFFLTGRISSKELKTLRDTPSQAARDEAKEKLLAKYPDEVLEALEETNILDKYSNENKIGISNILAAHPNEKVRMVNNILAAHPNEKVRIIDDILAKHPTEKLPASKVAEEEDMSLPAVLGTNGIYGIVIGLGISDALLKYVERITGTTEKPGTIANFFANNTAINQTMGNFTNSTNYTLMLYPIISISQLNLPETFRLAGFLFTIIPFIHGTILMFSKKWYQDSTPEAKPHYFVALLFFIVVFIITIMYYFIAVNILEPAFFIFSLWLVMAFNSGWLVVYSKTIEWKLKKQHLVRKEWVLLNLNTLAFLSVFLFASPNLLSLNQIVGNDTLLNFLILIVLFARVLTDYIIFWPDYYQPAIKLRRNSS